MVPRRTTAQLPALLALFVGALAIGGSGIFVRLSQTGPAATAFWRGMLALPWLVVWLWQERRRATARGTAASDGAVAFPAHQAARPAVHRRAYPLFFWGGVFFAGDLALWHTSLLLTPIAVSTLEANCAPVFVTLFSWLLWRQRPRPAFIMALALAFGGMLMIMMPKLSGGAHALLGDILGLGTACCYAGYILSVARLRASYPTGLVMCLTTAVFTLLLLPLALQQKFWPDTSAGWALLLAYALSAQVLGQGLIAYALAHLPATFSALGLYVQVLAAAVYAWIFLHEELAVVQVAGGLVVLAAIAIARRVAIARQ